ncbi:MAG: DNA-protecting protein DprA [Nitrospirae bacterium]|nr:DNA-protecting protein DprA [Nitrospirota bacterium]
MTDDLVYWIALSSIKDVGPVRARNLLKAFGSPEAVFNATLNGLTAVEGVGGHTASAIKSFRDWAGAERMVRKCEELGIRIIRYTDPSYPEFLREISDGPPLFYAKGEMAEEDRFAVAVVGPRKPTDYGVRVTDRIACELSSSGLTVVSGLARGIDTVAHKAALKCGGRSIAVLGSGLDVPYPPENAGLMKRIESDGCVISEYPLGTKPERENFPRRNRLISGLSLGVLVVEAASDSGALITARYALEQGREVFAVPGMITSARSSGTNALIKQGARLVEKASDIIEELAPQLKGFIKERKRHAVTLTDEERVIAEKLSPEPLHIDDLTRQTGLPPQRVLGILTTLELKGLVKQSGGKRFYIDI